MLYILIASALLCLSVKGYCGKKLSCFVGDVKDAYLFNFIRMLFCILIGIAFVFFDQAQSFLLPEGRMIAICFLAGFSNAAFLVCWILAVQDNSMVVMDVCLTLGSLLPSVLCLLLFSEAMSLPKMIGFALIVLATLILGGGSKKTERNSPIGVIFLICAALGDGMSGFAQQLYKQYYTEAGSLAGDVYYPKTIYHFYTYVFAALVLLTVLIGYILFIMKKTDNDETVALLRRQIDVHKMKLNSVPFEMIKSGEKTIELRLFDEKRQKVKTGHKIIFTNTTTGETINTIVVKLHRFDSFEELYKSLPLLKCGYTTENVDKAKSSDMEQYYSVEEQNEYGVVGIELCRLKQITDESVFDENKKKKSALLISPRAVLHIFIMAVCLFAANYFQTVATNDYGMSSQMLYPIIKGGCLITVNFIAMIFFGERITRRSVSGSLVALSGIISMSIL